MSKALTTSVLSVYESQILEAESEIDLAELKIGEQWVVEAIALEKIKKTFKAAKKKKQKPFGIANFVEYFKDSFNGFGRFFLSEFI